MAGIGHAGARMSPARVGLLTLLAMMAFAGNSILGRLALKETHIDAATFTSVRLISGALTLWLLLRLKSGSPRPAGHWTSALALFTYAATFSFAYIDLTTATGALLLFGAVQATMILYGLWKGERLSLPQGIGLALALGGLVGLLLPGLSAPPLQHSLLMLAAGLAWGVYSLRGRGVSNPLMATAGNFLRTVPMSLGLSLLMFSRFSFDSAGCWYALASGSLTSALGYAIWYAALPGLSATSAATVQLSVPVIAALGGVVLVDEAITLRLVLASVAILGGIGLVIAGKRVG
jgi:drug/metabolite transporter (DMT)-like permease